jgi:hypothetical protein
VPVGLVAHEKRIAINDSRCKGNIDHEAGDLLRQRVYGIALGYEGHCNPNEIID